MGEQVRPGCPCGLCGRIRALEAERAALRAALAPLARPLVSTDGGLTWTLAISEAERERALAMLHAEPAAAGEG